MKKNQSGFGIAGVIVILLLVGLVGAVGWLLYDRQKTDKKNDTSTTNTITEQKNTSKDSPKISDPYLGWNSGSFKYAKLSYKIPPNWKDITDNSKFQDGSTKYEAIQIKATDGFVLTMSVNNLPRGYESEPNNVVLDFKDIDGIHQWIITDNANGKVSRIYVGSGIKRIGDKIMPVANVGKDGFNIELSAEYEAELGSLTDFNQKQSVKEAKMVFESLKFN